MWYVREVTIKGDRFDRYRSVCEVSIVLLSWYQGACHDGLMLTCLSTKTLNSEWSSKGGFWTGNDLRFRRTATLKEVKMRGQMYLRGVCVESSRRGVALDLRLRLSCRDCFCLYKRAWARRSDSIGSRAAKLYDNSSTPPVIASRIIVKKLQWPHCQSAVFKRVSYV